MTLNPFAQADALINAGVGQCLSNATATYNGGPEFGVLFDCGVSNGFLEDHVQAPECAASFDMSKTPGLHEGSALLINGVFYTVSGSVHPDSSGWVKVVLNPEGGW